MGLPQGSVLSPLLYTIYVAELEECCEDGCQILQYADDVCIFSWENPLRLSLDSLEATLVRIHEYLKNLGLDLSIPKTKLCIFSPRNMALKQIARSNIDRDFINIDSIRVRLPRR